MISRTLGGHEVNRCYRRRSGYLEPFRFGRLASNSRCSLRLSPTVGGRHRNNWYRLESLSSIDVIPEEERKGLGFKLNKLFLLVFGGIKDNCGFGGHFDDS